MPAFSREDVMMGQFWENSTANRREEKRFGVITCVETFPGAAC
jgi:hypothetical protein